MSKPARLDKIEAGTVHLIIGMARSGKQLLVSTGCFKALTLEQSVGALVDIGVSVWQSDITCTDCLSRRIEKPVVDTDVVVPTEFGLVRPGDTILVRYGTEHRLSQADVADLAKSLRDRMPDGVKVVCFVADEMRAVRSDVELDTRPHSRACGIAQHDHGPACSSNCPTCGGKS